MESSYIDLLQDLLNRDTDPLSKPFLDRLWKHIALEPPRGLRSLIPAICSSPAIWNHSSSSISWNVALSTFSILVKATLAKAQLVKQEAGTGWFAHRTMRQFVDNIIYSLHEQQNTEQQQQQRQQQEKHLQHPSSFALPRIIVLSAVHVGLRSLLTRPFALDPNRSGILTASESALLDLWAYAAKQGHLEDLPCGENTNDNINTNGKTVPLQYIACWLAAQTLVGATSHDLRRIPPIPFVHICISTFCATFHQGTLFDGLDDDLVEATQGLAWKENAASKKRLKEISQSRLFLSLSFLSRLIGKVIETIRSTESLSQLYPELNKLRSLCWTIFSSWKNVRWSEITDSSLLDPSTRSDKVPWTIFKTLLFAYTMIHASTVSLLSTIPDGTRVTSANFQLLSDLASCTIETFSPLQFIASKFGNDGSGLLQYKALWHGALDFVKLGGSEGVMKTIQKIEPCPTTSRAYHGDIHPLDRGIDAYFLNVAEEWTPLLSDEYIESKILKDVVTPYLDGPRGSDAFEATHSVILSIFVNAKPCASKVLPWYTEFLIKNTSNALTPQQMRIGFAGAVKYASSIEDHLAWFCIKRLCDEIDASVAVDSSFWRTGASSSNNHHNDVDTPNESSNNKEGGEEKSEEEEETSASTNNNNVDKESKNTKKKKEKEKRHRTTMFMLIDQCGTVNSSLFPVLLDKIQAYIKNVDDINERLVLSRSLFATLSGGVDASKRLQAATWWTENGKDLVVPNKDKVEQVVTEEMPNNNNDKDKEQEQEEQEKEEKEEDPVKKEDTSVEADADE